MHACGVRKGHQALGRKLRFGRSGPACGGTRTRARIKSRNTWGQGVGLKLQPGESPCLSIRSYKSALHHHVFSDRKTNPLLLLIAQQRQMRVGPHLQIAGDGRFDRGVIWPSDRKGVSAIGKTPEAVESRAIKFTRICSFKRFLREQPTTKPIARAPVPARALHALTVLHPDGTTDTARSTASPQS